MPVHSFSTLSTRSRAGRGSVVCSMDASVGSRPGSSSSGSLPFEALVKAIWGGRAWGEQSIISMWGGHSTRIRPGGPVLMCPRGSSTFVLGSCAQKHTGALFFVHAPEEKSRSSLAKAASPQDHGWIWLHPHIVACCVTLYWPSFELQKGWANRAKHLFQEALNRATEAPRRHL
eukprot:581252-Pelagomonas_calceolata.AAC.6